MIRSQGLPEGRLVKPQGPVQSHGAAVPAGHLPPLGKHALQPLPVFVNAAVAIALLKAGRNTKGKSQHINGIILQGISGASFVEHNGKKLCV